MAACGRVTGHVCGCGCTCRRVYVVLRMQIKCLYGLLTSWELLAGH